MERLALSRLRKPLPQRVCTPSHFSGRGGAAFSPGRFRGRTTLSDAAPTAFFEQDNRELEARLRQADAAAAEARAGRAGADAERVRLERELQTALAEVRACVSCSCVRVRVCVMVHLRGGPLSRPGPSTTLSTPALCPSALWHRGRLPPPSPATLLDTK